MKQQVNLYRVVHPPKSPWPFSAKNTAIAGIIMVALIAGVSTASWKIYQLKQQYQFELSAKSIKEKAFAEMKKEANISIKQDQMNAELAALKVEIKGKKALKKHLQEQVVISTKGYLDYLIALARQDVKGVWLTQVILGDEGRFVTLSGRVTEPAHIATYLKRLSKEKIFHGVKFIEMRVDEPTQEQLDAGDTASSFVVSTHEVIDAVEEKPAGVLGLLQ